MKNKQHAYIRQKLKDYRYIKKELNARTEYLTDFKKILINPLSGTETSLKNIYNRIVNEMEHYIILLEKRLKVMDTIMENLDGVERSVIYYRYIAGKEWVDMPEFIYYEQRTCQIIETRVLEKILKMNIDWGDNNAE